jgi:hypothetical protein
MSELQHGVLAYLAACSGIAMLWRMALLNRASGWRRERHWTCYERTPVVEEAETRSPGAHMASTDLPLANAAGAMQLVAFAEAVSVDQGVSPAQDQNRECSPASAVSRK